MLDWLKTSVAERTEKATAFCQAGVLRGVVLLFCALQAGCAYRFTNEHMAPPTGVRTIAVEAIYDTSREVLPHELLWESLQSAFAADGHLRLAPQGSADALVRAHIKQASVVAVGSNAVNDRYPDNTVKLRDPGDPFGETPPPRPSDFRRLNQAGEYRDKAQIGEVVEVEVWNLNTRELLLKHTYPMAAQFQAVHRGIPGSTVANDHLRYDEASRAQFKTMADGIAAGVVRDLLVK